MNTFLREVNLRLIAKTLGFLLILEALFMLAASAVGWSFHRLENPAMLIASLTTVISGLLLFGINLNASKQMGKREGFLIVSLSWIVVAFFGSMPYYLGGHIPSFTDAFFETMSGFTTTGSSILSNVEALPPELLFWRSLTQWLGGMGIVVLSVAILPMLGIGGMQLFAAEMPGVTHEKLHPRITSTAKRLWGIYVLLSLLAFLSLWAGEMNWFDALNHAFTTMSTGGFSTRNSNLAAFGPYSQYVVVVFMVLAGTSYTLHYFMLHGKIRQVFHDEEFRVYLLILAGLAFVTTVGLVIRAQGNLEANFRTSLFTVASVLTTTGYVTEGYQSWPLYLSVFVVLLMFVGGMAGSASGGIKVVRQLLLLKNSWMELRRSVHPNAVLPVKYNNKSVPQEIIYKVMGFFLLYMLLFASGVVLLAAVGLDFSMAVGASVASLGNIGPVVYLGQPVQQVYAAMPDAAKWILSALMMFGRLEIFTLVIMTSRVFWRR